MRIPATTRLAYSWRCARNREFDIHQALLEHLDYDGYPKPWTPSTMTERNIAVEVLEGLREIREHQAGRRTVERLEQARSSPAGFCRQGSVLDFENHLQIHRTKLIRPVSSREA